MKPSDNLTQSLNRDSLDDTLENLKKPELKRQDRMTELYKICPTKPLCLESISHLETSLSEILGTQAQKEESKCLYVHR